MGSVASTVSKISEASDEELKACVAELSAESVAKVKAALASSPGRKMVLGANWKSNPATKAAVTELCAAWKGMDGDWKGDKVEAVLFAPTVYSACAKEALAGTKFQMGIQNISKTDCGAFTGEITAGQAADMGFTWAMIGHSERRTLYGETDADTFIKLTKAQEAGLCTMFCIGETKEERETGVTDTINKRMLEGALPLVTDWTKFVIAYEPVWAIGTGLVATPEQAQDTQDAIRKYVKEVSGDAAAAAVRIQYGGSANPKNCAELGGKPDIDGFLVGGASLKPEFIEMLKTASA